MCCLRWADGKVAKFERHFFFPTSTRSEHGARLPPFAGQLEHRLTGLLNSNKYPNMASSSVVIALGTSHACALLFNTNLMCWGLFRLDKSSDNKFRWPFVERSFQRCCRLLIDNERASTLSYQLRASASCKCCIFVLYFSEMLYLYSKCCIFAFYSTKNTAFEMENAVYFYPLRDSHNDWGVSGFIKPGTSFLFCCCVFTPVRMFRKLKML